LAPDPRFIGLIPSDLFNGAKVRPDSFFKAVESYREETVDFDGLPHKKISFVNLYEMNVEIWLDTSKNNGIKKVRAFREDQSSDQSVLSVLRKPEGSNIWFPSSVNFVRRINGKVRFHEKLTISELHVGDELAEEFSTSSIGFVKEGTPVSWRSEKLPPFSGDLVWEDGMIKGHVPAAIESIKHELVDESYRFWYVNFGILFVIIGLLVVFSGSFKKE
jgi:hypothetical protein